MNLYWVDTTAMGQFPTYLPNLLQDCFKDKLG